MMITIEVWLGASMQGCHNREVREAELFQKDEQRSSWEDKNLER